MAGTDTKRVKIAICLPWFDGADKDCQSAFLDFQHYLGRLQERSWWLARYPHLRDTPLFPMLDPQFKTTQAEFPAELIGTEFEFGIADEVGLSLPGMARERLVEYALKWEADYVLFYDDDMLFDKDLFLRLYLDQKPVVAALAFTARKPISPVIYKFYERVDPERKECTQCRGMVNIGLDTCPLDGAHAAPRHVTDSIPVFDYQRDALMECDAVGSGVMLIETAVFRKLPKPWFHSPGIGEDIFFCYHCRRHGIPVYVDTRVKTTHKPRFEEHWHNEKYYDRQLKEMRQDAERNHRSDTDVQQSAAAC
jgi:hypothetical protein